VLPESVSLEKLKHIRDEISTRRSTYNKMPETSAASSSAQTSNPVVQKQREVIGFILMAFQYQ
jgi:hypothetical protein